MQKDFDGWNRKTGAACLGDVCNNGCRSTVYLHARNRFSFYFCANMRPIACQRSFPRLGQLAQNAVYRLMSRDMKRQLVDVGWFSLFAAACFRKFNVPRNRPTRSFQLSDVPYSPERECFSQTIISNTTPYRLPRMITPPARESSCVCNERGDSKIAALADGVTISVPHLAGGVLPIYYDVATRRLTYKLLLTLLLLPLILSTSYFILPAPAAHASVVVGQSNTVALTKGLVGYWTFDGKNTNWATGKTNDLSGQGNTGQLISMSTSTSPVTGKIGQGLKFDNTSSVVDVGNVTTTNFGTGDFTMSAWIYNTSQTSRDCIICRDDNAANQRQFYLDLNSNNAGTVTAGGLTFGIMGTDANIAGRNIAAGSISPNKWHLITVGRRSGAMFVYIDGVSSNGTGFTQSSGVESQSMQVVTSKLQIGARTYASFNDNFAGNIDDVRIYNRALSYQEIQALYKEGAAKIATSNTVALTKGLVGYWTFDGKDTNWATGKTFDLSGQGNTGQLISMSTSTSPIVGKIGQGLKFDGNYVVIPEAVVINGPSTFSAWVKTSSSNLMAIVGENSHWSLDYGYGIIMNGGKAICLADGGYTGWQYYLISVTTINNSKWNHIVCTFNSWGANTTGRLYVNGVEVANYTNTASRYINYTSSIGAGNQSGMFFSGSIDDVRIYNRALSYQEIQALYKEGAVKIATSNTVALTKGLVGWWTFDGADTNWGTNKTNDLSGQGNTGTLTSMSTTTTPVAGKIGQALKFNGTSSYINNGTVGSGITNTVTVSAWINPKSGSGMIISDGWNYTSNEFGWAVYLGSNGHFNTNDRAISWSSSDNSGNYNSTAVVQTNANVISLNQWNFVTVTKSGTSINIYINGVLSKSGTISASSITYNNGHCFGAGFLFGVCAPLDVINGLYPNYFNGSIDDMRVYNRALSAGEVKQLYNMGR